MMRYLFCIIGDLFVSMFFIASICKFLNYKINLKSFKIYLMLFIFVSSGMLFTFALPQYLKISGTALVLLLTIYFLIERNFTVSVLISIMTIIILMLSEMILVFLGLFLGVDINESFNKDFGLFFCNFGTALIGYLLLKINIFNKVYNYIYETLLNVKKNNLFIYFIITILLVSLFVLFTHLKVSYVILIFVMTLLSLFYLVMLFRVANTTEKYKNINNKYEISLMSLREYEDMMDKYKVSNHENKNQLLMIRSMIRGNEKTKKYIDELVEDKIKDDEKIFRKVSKIPEGGLRATIYSKLCKMDDLNINYKLSIARDVKREQLIKIGNYTTLNICKIIGVFLDNAIEEVQDISDGIISIEIYNMENELYIDISNTYNGIIEIDKIYDKGYTTKGKEHGYGLSLVDRLVKEDGNIDREMKIAKDIFTQRIKIKKG